MRHLRSTFRIQLNGFNSGLFSNGTVIKTTVGIPVNYSSQIEAIFPISATEYYISAEENNSNSQGLYRLDISTLNIETYAKNNISFYPNPAQNSFTININECKTKIYSISGELVKTSFISKIDVTDLAKGIYLVEIQDLENDNFIRKRLIVN